MNLKKKFDTSKVQLGTWLTIPSPAVAEIICRANFDWIAIDLEHSAMSTSEAEQLIRVIDLSQKIPLVRLSNNDEVLIKKVMDAGAHGLIVPMVNSLSDVTHAYQSMNYPPKGKRGVGLARAQDYGSNFLGYWNWLAEEAILIIQIEHKNALDNLDDIFSSGKIDGYIIGPYDLSASLGIPGQFDHPDLKKALKLIEEKADQYKIPKGIHIVEMDQVQLKEKIDLGYKVIAYGVDFRVLDFNFKKAKAVFDDIERGKK